MSWVYAICFYCQAINIILWLNLRPGGCCDCQLLTALFDWFNISVHWPKPINVIKYGKKSNNRKMFWGQAAGKQWGMETALGNQISATLKAEFYEKGRWMVA